MESHCKEKKVESDEKVKRKPGRPRKHNVRPVVKDVPIGNDFNKATITTKTFTIKVENFSRPSRFSFNFLVGFNFFFFTMRFHHINLKKLIK